MMLLGLDKTYKKEKKDHRCAINCWEPQQTRAKEKVTLRHETNNRNKNVPVIKSLKDF